MFLSICVHSYNSIGSPSKPLKQAKFFSTLSYQLRTCLQLIQLIAHGILTQSKMAQPHCFGMIYTWWKDDSKSYKKHQRVVISAVFSVEFCKVKVFVEIY